jgi:hypothetical protein
LNCPKETRKVIAFALLMLGTAVFAGATNLVQNGSFETGNFSGWTLTGDTAFTGVCNNGSTPCPDNIPPENGNWEAYFGPVGDTATLSQMITTMPGTQYTLSFYLANPVGGTPNYFDVKFGTAEFSITNFGVPFGYQEFVLTTTATSSQTLLAFTFRNDPSYWYLDNVVVNAGGQGTTPEPSTLAMFGTGAIGLAGFARRKFRK